ncbi:MAG: GatB/YqeY domain-containing protein, partial [Opitutaceae bacterium]|nr:GatB/YqeY domain-containing protein [Opitutaceae bacterium]
VNEVIQATGATAKKDMGRVMGALKQRPEAGVIDFGAASKLIQAKLV